MAEDAIQCPHCHSERVVKYGRASKGKARYRWQTEACGRTFMRAYAYPGRTPYVKRQIVEMPLLGQWWEVSGDSGIAVGGTIKSTHEAKKT
jgi:transposase-like protein